MMSVFHGGYPDPHVMTDPGISLAKVIPKLGYHVFRHSNVRIDFRQETVVICFLEFVVFYAGIADPQDAGTVQLLGIFPVVDKL